jgi:hypothetical protein
MGGSQAVEHEIELQPRPVISTLASRVWDTRFARPVTMGGSQAAL